MPGSEICLCVDTRNNACYELISVLVAFYQPDVVLEDPSVGNTFTGHDGISKYFISYFIGYQTHTKIVELKILDNEHAYLEVVFIGNFPEGTIGGIFEFKFTNGKIAYLRADLIDGH